MSENNQDIQSKINEEIPSPAEAKPAALQEPHAISRQITESAPGGSAPPQTAPIPETVYTGKMKANFGFFGPVTLLYAAFYAFCMYHNGSGVTFPFFIAGSLLYLCSSLSKLEISLRKGSAFYMVSMMLLAVSTFCTDDFRIIAFNKTGIFFLMMSLLLHQFYHTSKWRLGKYLCSIFELVFCCLGQISRPFADCRSYFQKRRQKNKTLLYAALGAIIAAPLLFIVIALLGSADAVFHQMTSVFFVNINFSSIINVLFRILFLFMASYLLVAYLCTKSIREEVKDRRNGEPVLAITITGLLSAVYLLFSGIQIIYLFLGRMQLPQGYTYAMYAREGFFQLLAVSALNLIIVLICMSFFKESKVLKIILTIMSLCTFVMIASSALRMMIYIQYYYLTFLRIFVLWALAVLFFLFIGVVVSIFREKFPLFQYSMTAVTVLYIVLSFSHPDLIIAGVNVANASRGDTQTWERSQEDFFKGGEPYQDYAYLSRLSADAAPVLIPYLEELGYDVKDMEGFHRPYRAEAEVPDRYDREWFGWCYLVSLQQSCDNFSLRTYNISRHMALRSIEKYFGKNVLK